MSRTAISRSSLSLAQTLAALCMAWAACSCSSSSGASTASGGSGGSAGTGVAGNAGNANSAGAGGSSGSGTAGGGTAGQPASPTLCGTISSTGMLPDGAALLAGVPASAFTLFLKADETYVYWADNSNIHRVSIADGTDSIFYQPASSNHIGGIDVADGMLYFTESGVHSPLGIAKVATDGSSAPVSLAADAANFPTVAGGFVYYATGHSAIARVAIAGGTPVELVANIEFGEGRAMTVAGGYVWFVNPQAGGDADIHLQRVPIDAQVMDGGTSPVETLTSAGVHGASPVSDNSNVYFGVNGALTAIPLTGGTPVTLGETVPVPGNFGTPATQPDVLAILPIGGSVLWSEAHCTELHRTSPTGSALPAPLQQASISLLAGNSQYIFASNGSQIYKFPRPQ